MTWLNLSRGEFQYMEIMKDVSNTFKDISMTGVLRNAEKQ